MEGENKPKVPWWQPGLQLFLKLSGWIAGPVVIGAFFGKYLDKKYHTEPWLFLLSVGIAFIVSMAALVIIGFREIKRIEKNSKKKQ